MSLLYLRRSAPPVASGTLDTVVVPEPHSESSDSSDDSSSDKSLGAFGGEALSSAIDAKAIDVSGSGSGSSRFLAALVDRDILEILEGTNDFQVSPIRTQL